MSFKESKQHKRLCVLLLCGAAAVLALGAALLLRLGRPCGHLNVTVVDAYTGAPLKDATVVVPGRGAASTDAAGHAPLYGIPLEKNPLQERLSPQNWGECTLLIYRDGYLPYVLLHVHVHPMQLRNGPVVYLFPEGTESGISFTSVVEAPPDEWLDALVRQYAPVQ